MSGRAAPPTVIVMACATAAETQALARRAEAVHARLRAEAGQPSGSTGNRVIPTRANAAEQARAQWREAEKSFARSHTRWQQAREREAVFRGLVDAGWLPF